MKYNTMRLTEGPAEIGSGTRQAWGALFEAYGFETFHPIEGKGVLRAILGIKRDEAEAVLQRLIDRGFAIAP